MLFKKEGLMKYDGQLEMIYMSNNGVISQRRIKILKINGEILQAYCYLRGANRTFKIENILALNLISMKKGMVV